MKKMFNSNKKSTNEEHQENKAKYLLSFHLII